MRTIFYPIAFLSFVLAGCGTKEVLIQKSRAAPSVNTLSGQWTMLEDFDIAKRQLDQAIGATDGVDEERDLRRMSSARANGRRLPRPKVGGLVHVFLKNGKALKITQTKTGLFISFDRAVVEEYRFGETRRISVGELVAQRVSGWEGEQFVVETLDNEGMKLTERYHLLENGMRLRRQIVLRGKNGQEIINFQTYERDSD